MECGLYQFLVLRTRSFVVFPGSISFYPKPNLVTHYDLMDERSAVRDPCCDFDVTISTVCLFQIVRSFGEISIQMPMLWYWYFLSA